MWLSVGVAASQGLASACLPLVGFQHYVDHCANIDAAEELDSLQWVVLCGMVSVWSCCHG